MRGLVWFLRVGCARVLACLLGDEESECGVWKTSDFLSSTLHAPQSRRGLHLLRQIALPTELARPCSQFQGLSARREWHTATHHSHRLATSSSATTTAVWRTLPPRPSEQLAERQRFRVGSRSSCGTACRLHGDGRRRRLRCHRCCCCRLKRWRIERIKPAE